MATCIWTALPEAASSCSGIRMGAMFQGCPQAQSLHCTSVLVTVNDHLLLILKFTPKGLNGY